MLRRERVRLALSLQQAWQQGQQQKYDLVLPLSTIFQPYMKRLRAAENTLTKARQHGLGLIEPLLLDAVKSEARSLRITLQDHEGCHFPQRYPFPLRDFYRDLIQLEEEFPAVRVDWEESLLIVETDTIILEALELGHFTMRLNWDWWARHGNLDCLRVIAEEPHPSELNDEVPHPHVRSGELCSGEALPALEKSLREGRLAEFFLLAWAVLTNYNPASAYVRLDEWQGIPCYDCGEVINPEERSYCERCDHEYCSNCISSCSGCDAIRCHSCLTDCSVCQQPCCGNCLETSAVSEQQLCRHCQGTCPSCHTTIGPDDVHAETGLCPDCHQNLNEENSDETVSTAVS